MKKKIMLSLFSLFIIAVIAYVIIFLNTNSLINDVKDVFLQRVNYEEIEGKPVRRYYDGRDVSNAKQTIKIHRLFTIHNFREGYIWVNYTYQATDMEGKLMMGSWQTPSKWKIKKINGRWEIAQIWEAP